MSEKSVAGFVIFTIVMESVNYNFNSGCISSTSLPPAVLLQENAIETGADCLTMCKTVNQYNTTLLTLPQTFDRCFVFS